MRGVHQYGFLLLDNTANMTGAAVVAARLRSLGVHLDITATPALYTQAGNLSFQGLAHVNLIHDIQQLDNMNSFMQPQCSMYRVILLNYLPTIYGSHN